MRSKLLTIMALFISNILFGQNIESQKLYSSYVLNDNIEQRDLYYNNLQTILFNDISLSNSQRDYNNYLKEAILRLDYSTTTKSIVERIIMNYEKVSNSQLYYALSIYFYNNETILDKRILDIFQSSNNDNILLLIYSKFINRNKPNIEKAQINLAEKYFRGKSLELKKYMNSYFDRVNDKTLPQLKELLYAKYQENKTIIFSFFRKDRRYPGITLIRKPDGNFLKNSNGNIFFIQQLGLSACDLIPLLRNGNTPQGIYSIVGWYISPTQSIGPTPNILIRMVKEVDPSIFYHSKKIVSWNIQDYRNLLPQNWKNFSPLYEAFFAGELGRKLIIMHGSTDDLKYYRDQIYYPLSPSLGCLTATEIWDSNNGKLIASDQVKLINAFKSLKQQNGFLIVLNLDDKKKPVTIEDLLPAINN